MLVESDHAFNPDVPVPLTCTVCPTVKAGSPMFADAMPVHMSAVWCCTDQYETPLYPPGLAGLAIVLSWLTKVTMSAPLVKLVEASFHPCPIGASGLMPSALLVPLQLVSSAVHSS